MKFFILFYCLLLSCATTKFSEQQSLKYSYLPSKINIDSLLPFNIKDSIVDFSLQDFKSMQLDSGRLITIYKDTIMTHSGILISEKKAALYVFYKNNCEYLDKKIILSNSLYTECIEKSLIAEKIYQEEIKNLKKQTEYNWLKENLVYFGFFAGIITAILTEFAVVKVL
jgi:hypothetical protein